LQRFAKPWWKRRAVRIFRDESSLSANPHLWSSITEALDTSGWFVLLLSPDAAGSEWVNQEIGYWVENRDPKKILPVVTDGTFGWADDGMTGDAMPDALQGVFTEEPRWVDMRWAKGEEQLDLQNPRFADAIADIGSAIRGVPKDELSSEEVRQHRRTVRTAWAAGGLVTVLAIAAVGFGIQSARNADEAERQAQRAQESATEAQQSAALEAVARSEAERSAEEALKNADRADREAAAALRSEALAKTRQLAASSVNAANEDPQLALALAVRAADILPDGEPIGAELEAALRGAMSQDRLLARYDRLEEASPTSFDVSPDGSLVALAVLASRTLQVLDAETLEPLWIYTEDTRDVFEWVAFSSDGAHVVLSVADERFARHERFVAEGDPTGEPDARFLVFDSQTGDVLHAEVLEGACAVNVHPGGWRADLGLMGFGFVGCGSDGEFGGTIRFLDTGTWTTVFEWEAADSAHVVFGGAGSSAAMMSGPNSEPRSAIVDTATWEIVRALDVPWGALSDDGSVFAADAGVGVRLEDTATGEVIDRVPTESFFIWEMRFSEDGLLVLPFIGDETAVIDPSTGAEVGRITTGPTMGAVLREGKLYTASDGVLSVWDQAGVSQGDLNTIPLGLWVNSNSIFQADGTAVAHVYEFSTDLWWLYPVASDGTLGSAWPATDIWELTAIPGNRVLIQRSEDTSEGRVSGPIEVFDLGSGTSVEVAGCWMAHEAASRHEHCSDGEPNPSGIIAVVGSRSGDEVLIFDELQQGEERETWVSIWNTRSMTETERLNLGNLDAWGNQLMRSALTADLLILHNSHSGSLEVLDRETLEAVPIEGQTTAISRLEHDPVHNALWLTDFSDRVLRLDLDRLVVETVTSEGMPGFARGLAASPAGDRIAVGSTDGALRVFSRDGTLLHRIPLPNPSDALWLDDSHLAVGTANGPWTTITLDPAELAAVARSRLRRSFTATECQFYAIDPCPTLEELKGG
jgi:WD40 repeat protein